MRYGAEGINSAEAFENGVCEFAEGREKSFGRNLSVLDIGSDDDTGLRGSFV